MCPAACVPVGGGEPRLVEHGLGRLAALDVQEVVAAHELDRQSRVPAWLAGGGKVLGVVVEVLGGQPVRGEKRPLIRGEIGARVPLAVGVEAAGFVPQGTQFFSEIVVFHGWWN